MTTEAPLGVCGAELEVALGEVDAVLAMVPECPYRLRLEQLRAELTGDGLGAETVGELDRLLGIALQSGRLRAIYGPGGEAAAIRLYRKLPTGRELAQSATEVTEALRTLSGQTLDDISLATAGPGSFALTLTVAGRELAVRLDRQGIRLHAVGA